MATELRDLTIEEVSLVDAPANKGARVVLMKRDPLAKYNEDQPRDDDGKWSGGGGSSPSSNSIERLGNGDQKISFGVRSITLSESVQANIADLRPGGSFNFNDRMGNPWVATRPQGALNVKIMFRSERNKDNPRADVIVNRKELVKKGGIMEPNTEERASLLKRLAQYLGVETVPPAENEEGAGDMADEALKKQVDELTKQLDEVTKALAAEKAAREKAEKSVEDAAKAVEQSAKYQDFRSKMSPALQKAMDEMDEKEREEFMSRFGKAEDPVAKALAVEAKKAADAIAERDARIAKLESADRIAKRREELKDLAGVEKFNEFVEAIDAVYLKDSAAADEIVKRLKALAAQAKAGDLFKVAGRDGEGTGDAETGIKAAVAKVMAAEPALTREQAVEKALKANPALYDAYLAEQSKE